MIYKGFQDLKLSALGMGCMRLPVNGRKGDDVDQAAVEEMIGYAMEQGVNYFDTAWGYHGGNSEKILGQCLKKYPRDSYYLATKFPGYALSNMDKVEEIFEEQLVRCQTDHFDFYLFHNVCEMNLDAYLDPAYGIFAYLMKQKENGRIRHLGFSTHGSCQVIRRFLEAYGHQMEFCQIQLNYLDWTFQDAAAKVDLLNKKGIPVWVMEPLRGGRLARLSGENLEALQALDPDRSPAEWAFRFLQTVPGVTVILSGMSDLSQLKDNVRMFSNNAPLNDREKKALLAVGDRIRKENSLPCTECRYCMPHCPRELDIPELLKLYNEHRYTGGGFIAPMALQALDRSKRPEACLGCRSCEAVCPQQIKISEVMAQFAEML